MIKMYSTLFLWSFVLCTQTLFAFSDSARITQQYVYVNDTLEASAEQGEEMSLEMKFGRQTKWIQPSQSEQFNLIPPTLPIKDDLSTPSQTDKKLIEKQKNFKKNFQKPHQKPSKSPRKKKGLNFWKLWGKFLELDWLTVLIFTIIPALLIAGLYILLRGTVLSFFEMFLFALGFGIAIFSWAFADSENDGGTALYEYFVKFGLFGWVGILMIIAGFVGLFGGAGGSLLGYMLIGAILGGISFIISLIMGNSFLNK